MNTPVDPKEPGNNPVETIEVVDLYQKREQIYTRSFKGIYRNLRLAGGWFLFLLYFGFAWVNWEGQQIILWDLPARKFHLFGTTFWPQDFMLLSWLLIICAFGLFFITVLAGRIWCGYTCPQSVYTWIYMWAERVTEGERNRRIKLDQEPVSAGKLLRKSAKHAIWLFIAFATGVTFVGYFTPIRELVPNLLSLEVGAWATFWILFFTVCTYVNAGFLREQVCIYMCPYARFQSVMFDQDTLIVSYDPARGETRGPRRKEADYKAEGLGDCIDCKVCVHVCPVGIDIRDGLQYECIGCAACIDGCDEIMDKMGYPRGLISYTTEHNLEGGKTKILRPRLLGYLAVLLIMIGMVVYTLNTRIPLSMEVLRDRNSLFSETNQGMIENVYTLKIANMDGRDHHFQITASGLEGLSYEGEEVVLVHSGDVASVPVRLQADPRQIKTRTTNIQFEVRSVDDERVGGIQESRFIGPTQL
ncbi:cytochrome c oxidase accessory protein CcoG [Aestuariirhabdus litorea]|uniref:Cytochrome c oxidase accessory protein CcoG n=1 Tax=Aestuariirhabdus litorea TaxID=2528527 RepID=A0A3P3VSI7_9GAMM|nr:cytochrome c oxidase accessory protein CcoG [Aestuariirhabdus litorea]RRJ84459.1 cytochrome c oxidase accessory protein CcoG [Aestuariirhabdus litorea]RWW97683.1 cytochrome c oxidase accessory protein CcoG [Endozoicomonadaceae bacterium GTF-13]